MLVTLDGFSPPPTYPPDAVIFNRARIEESPDAVVPTVIEAAFLLVPQYVDPADPPEYNFSSNNASLELGYYRVVFLTAANDEAPSPWVRQLQPQPWQPSIREVGKKVYTRTRTTGGVYIGTFNDLTIPTGDDVAELIQDAVVEVYGQIQAAMLLSITGATELTAAQSSQARNVASLYAAMLVELSHFAEQINTDQSPYEKLKELYDEGLESLTDSIKGYDTDEAGSGGEAPGGSSGAVWSFPANTFPTEL